MTSDAASGAVSAAPILDRPAPSNSNARRPCRERQPLGASLQRFVDGASTDDLASISSELDKALSHTKLKSWNDVKGSLTSPSLSSIHSRSMAYLTDGKGGSGIIGSSRRGSRNEEWGTIQQPKNTNMVSNQLFAAMSLARPPQSIAQTNEGGSYTNNDKKDGVADKEPEYYGPSRTTRRNSKAGKELISSMKMKAHEVLAELGDLDDSEHSNGSGLGLGELREESMRAIMREDSKHIGNWDREGDE